mgnify:CR=1 FL=1
MVVKVGAGLLSCNGIAREPEEDVAEDGHLAISVINDSNVSTVVT